MSPPSREQWSPLSWPVSFRWRLLAAAVVLALTATAIFALSRGNEPALEVSVVVAAQRWPEGHPPGDHAVISVPADLASLLVKPSGLVDMVASVDVPEGSLVSLPMLRSRHRNDDDRTTSLMQFKVNSELWPDPGPASGNRAVFSRSPGGCAVALVPLVMVAEKGAGTLVTLEATPELAGLFADEQWWIWESPPGGWPACQAEPSDAVPAPAPSDEGRD
ncbi:MAG: hypothetical protein OXF99_05325 [bacterium]|nr:hypothetical protein [bacterium]